MYLLRMPSSSEASRASFSRGTARCPLALTLPELTTRMLGPLLLTGVRLTWCTTTGFPAVPGIELRRCDFACTCSMLVDVLGNDRRKIWGRFTPEKQKYKIKRPEKIPNIWLGSLVVSLTSGWLGQVGLLRGSFHGACNHCGVRGVDHAIDVATRW